MDEMTGQGSAGLDTGSLSIGARRAYNLLGDMATNADAIANALGVSPGIAKKIAAEVKKAKAEMEGLVDSANTATKSFSELEKKMKAAAERARQLNQAKRGVYGQEPELGPYLGLPRRKGMVPNDIAQARAERARKLWAKRHIDWRRHEEDEALRAREYAESRSEKARRLWAQRRIEQRRRDPYRVLEQQAIQRKNMADARARLEKERPDLAHHLGKGTGSPKHGWIGGAWQQAQYWARLRLMMSFYRKVQDSFRMFRDLEGTTARAARTAVKDTTNLNEVMLAQQQIIRGATNYLSQHMGTVEEYTQAVYQLGQAEMKRSDILALAPPSCRLPRASMPRWRK